LVDFSKENNSCLVNSREKRSLRGWMHFSDDDLKEEVLVGAKFHEILAFN